ncbi:MAG TPA: CHC2 zinc finger domain-containing protein [Verrucomicrobiales bacterium]|nr:CHC2 zinc finger domain-containing protein [Verrucomicrobiales bacterium]
MSSLPLRARINEAKDRLRIPELWRLLQLPGNPPQRGAGGCVSPFRADRHPSFSIFDEGRMWKDHATGDGGDAVHFLMHAEQTDRRTALRRLLDLANVSGGAVFPRRDDPVPVFQRARAEETTENRKYPDVSMLHRATAADIEAIARLRRVDAAAVARAAYCGHLRTGFHSGHRCWALADGPPGEPDCIAEIRRIDGKNVPAQGHPEGIRGKTLPGSRKDWPVGVSLLAHPDARRLAPVVLLCEGMPDLLAAHHFIHRAGRQGLYPVTVLGRNNNVLHPLAVSLLSALRIRIYAHADSDGGGLAAAARWAAQLPGCDIDAFDFTRLRRTGGIPVNDLNDCTDIHPDDAAALSDLLPGMTGK